MHATTETELLEVIEFCEAAFLDHLASEDGLDVETSRRLAGMCSDVLVANRRVSAMVESSRVSNLKPNQQLNQG